MDSRAKAIEFAERVPTLRISADLKVHLFRNKRRDWDWNMLRDIDALSIAVPYCHIVVADKDAVSLLHRTGADELLGTTVTAKLGELPQLLDELATTNVSTGSAWDELGPDDGRYHLETPTTLRPYASLVGATPALVDTAGNRVLPPRTRPTESH